jgi:Tfp pilus assembly protein PilN
MSAPNELSFLPDDYLERKARRRANAVCAGLSVVVMGAIAGAFWTSERSMREVETRATKVSTDYADAAKSIEQTNRIEAQQQKIVRQADLAASLVEKVPRSILLAEFTNRLPGGTSLLDLALESRVRAAPPPPANTNGPRGAAPAAPPPPQPMDFDVHMKLTGVADSDVQVAEFMKNLTSLNLVTNVTLLVTDQFKHGDRDMRRFQIEMMQDPKAEVTELPQKTSTAAVELKEKE